MDDTDYRGTDQGPGDPACAEARAVALARAGQDAGYRILMDAHREPVFRFLRGLLGNESDALDVTQEAFVAAFLALDRYDPARPFRAWILRIARNKSHDFARRRAVRRLLSFALPIEEAGELADPSANPEDLLSGRGEVERIHAAIASLPDKLKEPLLLCSLEGMSQEEAARVLGTSRKAIETRIYRARQKLSDALEG